MQHPSRGLTERDFTADDIAVMAERRFGWEDASCATLALIFGTTPQHVAALTNSLRTGHDHNPARCGSDLSHSFHEVLVDDAAQ